MTPRLGTAPPLITWPSAAIIPLVNVALLVTGFLLLGPSFVTATGVPLQLPNAVTAESVGSAAVTITITETGLLYVNGRLTALEELTTTLPPLVATGQTVLIKADARVPMGTMAAVWDRCRQAGAARIATATTRSGA